MFFLTQIQHKLKNMCKFVKTIIIIIIIIILLKFKFNRFLNLHNPHIASLNLV